MLSTAAQKKKKLSPQIIFCSKKCEGQFDYSSIINSTSATVKVASVYQNPVEYSCVLPL